MLTEKADFAFSKQEIKDKFSPSLLIKEPVWRSFYEFRKHIDLQREVGKAAPSVALCLAMHKHVVVVLDKFSEHFPIVNTTPSLLQQSLFASAFAEGISNADIFKPSVTLQITPKGGVVSGVKKPCTLASMCDYFLMSCLDENTQSLRLVVLPNSVEIEKSKAFWGNGAFRFSDTQEVRFSHLAVDEVYLDRLPNNVMQEVLNYGLSLFNTLCMASYLGIYDRLVEFSAPFIKQDTDFQRQQLSIAMTCDVLLALMSEKANSADVNQDNVNTVLILRYQIEQQLQQGVRLIEQRIGLTAISSTSCLHELMNLLSFSKYHPVSQFQYFTSLLK